MITVRVQTEAFDLAAETRQPTFTLTGISFPTLTMGQPAVSRTVTVRSCSDWKSTVTQ